MLLALHPNWWEDWELYHKVTFDGLNKLIIVNSDVSSIDVKTDIYSSWKEWASLRDNAKFPAAIRTTGGDPIGGGQFTGDVYFLINGWRIIVDHSCEVDGVIYSDDYPSPFVQVVGTQIVTNKVSSLVSVVSTSGGTGSEAPSASEVANAVWTTPTRSLTYYPPYAGPTASQIADEVRVELTPELTKIMAMQTNPVLTESQATMLAELYAIMGLDPTKPLVVNLNSRHAGDIDQTISTSPTQTIVTRT